MPGESLTRDNRILIRLHEMKHGVHVGKLRNHLESLLRHSPSESVCYMHMFEDPHGYLCKLTIHSSVKIFSSQCKDEDLLFSLKSVLGEVKKQIAKWKKNRSTMDLTGVTSIDQLDLSGVEKKKDKKEDLIFK